MLLRDILHLRTMAYSQHQPLLNGENNDQPPPILPPPQSRRKDLHPSPPQQPDPSVDAQIQRLAQQVGQLTKTVELMLQSQQQQQQQHQLQLDPPTGITQKRSKLGHRFHNFHKRRTVSLIPTKSRAQPMRTTGNMVSHRLTWNRHLWDQLGNKFVIRKKGVVPPLPDDIIVEILSRLSAEDSLKCKRVCRKWRDLTTTSFFAEKHLERSTPVTVMQLPSLSSSRRGKLDLFFLDVHAKRDMMIKKVYSKSLYVEQPQNQPRRNQNPALIGCCNGLLMFTTLFSLNYFICNPITREQINFRRPGGPAATGFLCGFFFHSLTKEYRLLWVYWEGNSVGYLTCTLGPMLWRKLRPFGYVPRPTSPPIIMNDFLYWMVADSYENKHDIPACGKSIMMFNMNNEKFHARPHPGEECDTRVWHRSMNILEMEDQLSLCDVYPDQVDIWILKDHANWIWVRKYVVQLEWDVKFPPTRLSEVLPHYGCEIKPVSIQNEVLLLWCTHRGLFQCHLKLKTFRKVKTRGVKKLVKKFTFMLCAFSYTPSLVSLKRFPETKVQS